MGTPRRRGDEAKPAMRFYSGELEGKLRHHCALVERSTLQAAL
jgi:hypothetical protein